VNIGYSKDVSIKDLALLIKEVVGYPGEIKFDELREEDMPKRLLDIRKANKLGWAPKTSIKEGIKLTYDWFLKNKCGK
jgi:GDP-L-fucose synthase